jgi:hypothetical protein
MSQDTAHYTAFKILCADYASRQLWAFELCHAYYCHAVEGKYLIFEHPKVAAPIRIQGRLADLVRARTCYLLNLPAFGSRDKEVWQSMYYPLMQDVETVLIEFTTLLEGEILSNSNDATYLAMIRKVLSFQRRIAEGRKAWTWTLNNFNSIIEPPTAVLMVEAYLQSLQGSTSEGFTVSESALFVRYLVDSHTWQIGKPIRQSLQQKALEIPETRREISEQRLYRIYTDYRYEKDRRGDSEDKSKNGNSAIITSLKKVIEVLEREGYTAAVKLAAADLEAAHLPSTAHT